MHRLYCPEEVITGRQIIISQQEQIHYLCRVLRTRVNDDIIVFDGQGHKYYCQIQRITNDKITLLIKEKIKSKPQWKTNLTIACALPKQKSRFDDLVDKLSQLGVDKIIPMITERVIVRWDSDQKQRHHQRWRKIAQTACAQSGRNILPHIEPIKEINQILIGAESCDLKLMPTLMENKQTLRDSVGRRVPKSILVIIGPEGDFTKQELTQAENAGFIPVFLGNLVLRVDTAAIAVASFFRLWELLN